MDARSARDYEIQEGHSARQQFAYIEDEDEDESSFPGIFLAFLSVSEHELNKLK